MYRTKILSVEIGFNGKKTTQRDYLGHPVAKKQNRVASLYFQQFVDLCYTCAFFRCLKKVTAFPKCSFLSCEHECLYPLNFDMIF